MVTFCGPPPKLKSGHPLSNPLTTIIIQVSHCLHSHGGANFSNGGANFLLKSFSNLLASSECTLKLSCVSQLATSFFFLLLPLGAISLQVWDQRTNHAAIKDASLQLLGPFACALRPPTCPTSLGNFFHDVTNLG